MLVNSNGISLDNISPLDTGKSETNREAVKLVACQKHICPILQSNYTIKKWEIRIFRKWHDLRASWRELFDRIYCYIFQRYAVGFIIPTPSI